MIFIIFNDYLNDYLEELQFSNLLHAENQRASIIYYLFFLLLLGTPLLLMK